jgi:hypothetical protein
VFRVKLTTEEAENQPRPLLASRGAFRSPDENGDGVGASSDLERTETMQLAAHWAKRQLLSVEPVCLRALGVSYLTLTRTNLVAA